MKTTMTVTIPQNGGEMLYYTIEFKKSDFMAVVEEVGELTTENVFTNPLWKVL